MESSNMETRNCLRCDGLGTVFSKGFTTSEGKVYPDQTKTCSCCNGEKTFPSFLNEKDIQTILNIILASKGKNKGRLKSAFPSPLHSEPLINKRAYYVWRFARFHGGVDMTMPMTADMILRGDPFKKELDYMADQVAKQSFGTDLAAAKRWMGLLG